MKNRKGPSTDPCGTLALTLRLDYITCTSLCITFLKIFLIAQIATKPLKKFATNTIKMIYPNQFLNTTMQCLMILSHHYRILHS